MRRRVGCTWFDAALMELRSWHGKTFVGEWVQITTAEGIPLSPRVAGPVTGAVSLADLVRAVRLAGPNPALRGGSLAEKQAWEEDFGSLLAWPGQAARRHRWSWAEASAPYIAGIQELEEDRVTIITGTLPNPGELFPGFRVGWICDVRGESYLLSASFCASTIGDSPILFPNDSRSIIGEGVRGGVQQQAQRTGEDSGNAGNEEDPVWFSTLNAWQRLSATEPSSSLLGQVQEPPTAPSPNSQDAEDEALVSSSASSTKSSSSPFAVAQLTPSSRWAAVGWWVVSEAGALARQPDWLPRLLQAVPGAVTQFPFPLRLTWWRATVRPQTSPRSSLWWWHGPGNSVSGVGVGGARPAMRSGAASASAAAAAAMSAAPAGTARLRLRVNRTAIGMALARLLGRGPSASALQRASEWAVEFAGDMGFGRGPTAEFVYLGSRWFQLAGLGLWRGERSATREHPWVSSGSQGLFPQPLGPWDASSDAERRQRLARFARLGRFLGKVLWDGRESSLQLPLSKALCKAIVGAPMRTEDVIDVDPSIGRSVRYLQSVMDRRDALLGPGGELPNDSASQTAWRQLTEEVEMMQLQFVFPEPIGPQGSYVPIPFVETTAASEVGTGGEGCGDGNRTESSTTEDGATQSSKRVTLENLDTFLHELSRAVLVSSVALPVQAIRDGLSMFVDPTSLRIFSAGEISWLLGGDSAATEADEDAKFIRKWELQMWKKSAILPHIECAHGYSKDPLSPTVDMFLTFMESLSPDRKKLLLRFLTGSPRLPVDGFGGLQPKLTIVRADPQPGLAPDELLPSCSTCSVYLKLPEYSTLEVLAEKCNIAISEGQEFFGRT